MKSIKLYDVKTLKTLRERAKNRPRTNSTIPPEKLVEYDAETRRLHVHHNFDVVSKLVHDTNGKAVRHTYDTLDIYRIARDAEAKLEESGIPASHRAGIRVSALSEAPKTKSYKYPTICGCVWLRRTTTAWVLESYARADRWPGPGADEKITIKLTPESEAALYSAAMVGFLPADKAAARPNPNN